MFSPRGLFSLLPRDIFDIILRKCDRGDVLTFRACSKTFKEELHNKTWWWKDEFWFYSRSSYPSDVIGYKARIAYRDVPYYKGKVKRKYISAMGKLRRRKRALERLETDVEDLNDMRRDSRLCKKALKSIDGKLGRRKAARKRLEGDIECLEDDRKRYEKKKHKINETVRIFEQYEDEYK